MTRVLHDPRLAGAARVVAPVDPALDPVLEALVAQAADQARSEGFTAGRQAGRAEGRQQVAALGDAVSRGDEGFDASGPQHAH